MSQAADSDVDSDLEAASLQGSRLEGSGQWPEALSSQSGDWSNDLSETDLSETIAPLPPVSHDPPPPYLRLPVNHAEPLMPMQERDLKAIRDLFEQEGIEAIEADILENLPYHNPELPWDDWGVVVLRDLFGRS